PDAAVGTLASQLSISGAGWPGGVTIPVLADVRNAVLTAPAVITLRRAGPGPAKLLVWRADGADLGELRQRHLPPGVTVAEDATSGARRRLFLVALDATTARPGQGPEEMTLAFQGVEEVVRIPLNVE